MIKEEKYKNKVENAFEIASGEKINLDTVDIRKAINDNKLKELLFGDVEIRKRSIVHIEIYVWAS